MRFDFCRMTSTTGGTSTLTCTAQSGYPIISKAFTGTRLVDYTIAEYTDSTKATLSKAETGVGSYNTSTEVLTRTKVLSTWDGTNYLPKFGTATAPTAISFGSTSANIDIMVSPTSATGPLANQFVYGNVASVADGVGQSALNLVPVGAVAFTSGTVYYTPYLLIGPSIYSQWSVRRTTALTGGTPTLDCAIYEVASDGTPGKMLINFTQLTGVGTTNTTYTSTAIATPIALVPGWYYVGFLYVANSATGTMSVRGGALTLAGPQGTYFGNATGFMGPKSLASQTVLNDPATAATSAPDYTAGPAIYFK